MATDEPDMTMEEQREGLSLFLRWLDSELHDPSWTPTAGQVRDLHRRIADPVHAWLLEVGRRP